MAATYPEHVRAWHTNLPVSVNSYTILISLIDLNSLSASAPSLSKTPLLVLRHLITPYTPEEKAGMDRMMSFMQTGYGYNILQATQPQTLNYSLADSPVGLLAWIYEKLVNWSDDYPWTDDEGGHLFFSRSV